MPSLALDVPPPGTRPDRIEENPLDSIIATRLRHCETLPSLPALAVRVIALANDPATQMTHIADAVALDAALSVKMLKVANSPLFAARRRADSVRQAISLLGTHAAISIALSFSLAAALSRSRQTVIDIGRFLRRAILSAIAARALGESLKLDHIDDIFLAGLLQDIGVLALCSALGSDYSRIVAAAGADHDALLLAERSQLGSGHDEVGAWLMERWHLPDGLVRSVLLSHSALSDSAPAAVRCVALAGCIADLCLKAPGAQNAYPTAERLGIDPALVEQSLHTIATLLPEMHDLFEVDLLTPEQATAMLDHARELQAIYEINKTRELEDRSQRDPLTGAYNRGFFDETLRREFEIATRRQWPLSVALIDLDHFKAINDTYGHPTGDAVLVAIARAAMGQLRQTDALARYGGEEFAMILPDTGQDQAVGILERLKQGIAEICYGDEQGLAVRVTASIGVATFGVGHTPFTAPSEVIKAADRALYVAKRSGRNRVSADESRLPVT